MELVQFQESTLMNSSSIFPSVQVAIKLSQCTYMYLYEQDYECVYISILTAWECH